MQQRRHLARGRTQRTSKRAGLSSRRSPAQLPCSSTFHVTVLIARVLKRGRGVVQAANVGWQTVNSSQSEIRDVFILHVHEIFPAGSIRRTFVICDEAMIAVEPTARSVVYDIARLGGNGRLRSTRSVGLHRAPARGGASRATVLAAIHTSRTSRYDTVCCHIVTRRSLVHTTDTLTQLVQN